MPTIQNMATFALLVENSYCADQILPLRSTRNEPQSNHSPKFFDVFRPIFSMDHPVAIGTQVYAASDFAIRGIDVNSPHEIIAHLVRRFVT